MLEKCNLCSIIGQYRKFTRYRRHARRRRVQSDKQDNEYLRCRFKCFGYTGCTIADVFVFTGPYMPTVRL